MANIYFSVDRASVSSCLNPLRRFNFCPKTGHIAVGADADFAILDPSARWTIYADELRSSSGWAPYEGLEVEGKIARTILRGTTTYDGKDVTFRPGDGVFVRALRLSTSGPA